jgi:small-conductance mechanosensitive channel
MISISDIHKRVHHYLKYLCISLIILISLSSTPVINAENEQEATGPPETNEAAPKQEATVIIDGTPLFKVVGISTLPAKQRAEQIAEIIQSLAQDPSFDTTTIEVKEIDGLFRIIAGEKHIVAVFEEDIKIEGDFSPLILAKELFLPKIIQAIESYRSEREPNVLFKNILHALVRTVILSLLLFLLFWGLKKIDHLTERHFKRKIDDLETKSLQIVQSKQIWSVLQKINLFIRLVLILIILYFFINFVLNLFPWTRYISETLLGYVIGPLISMGQAVIDYLPSLFFLIMLFFVVRYLLKITNAFFGGIDRGQIKLTKFDAEWAWPTYRIVRVLIIILAVVGAYPYIPGSGSEGFKGISLLLGVLFSLGSSSLIANVIAGYTMTYRRAFKVGDRVKIGTNVGEVTEIRLLVTHLRSLKNEEIVIPNSTILSGEITNFSSMAGKHGLILHTTVGIGYEVPWRQVEAMLLMAAERTEGLQRKSQPFVLQTGLGDFGINYELNVFTKRSDKMPQIYADLHRNIQDVFNEYEVAIMTPHYQGDTEDPKFVPKEQWYLSPAKPPASNQEID